MFDSVDNEEDLGGGLNPTVIVGLVLGGIAYLLASLLGSTQSQLSLIFVAGLIIAMSAEWEFRRRWFFWIVSIGRLILDTCLVVFISWPAIYLKAPALIGLGVLNGLINLALIAGVASMFGRESAGEA